MPNGWWCALANLHREHRNGTAIDDLNREMNAFLAAPGTVVYRDVQLRRRPYGRIPTFFR
jgi:hypothetical protein